MKTIQKANSTLIFSISFMFLSNVSAQNNGQWEILNEGIRNPNTIDLVNEDIGWIAAGNTLWKTEDGGETWNALILPDGMNIDYIDFSSVSIGWSIGYTEENGIRNLYKTEDGGITWRLSSDLPENFHLHYIAVVSDSVIFITGNITGTSYCAGWIYKTTDGGSSWNDITPASFANHIDLHSVHFYDAKRGFVSGKCFEYLIILSTFNGGDTWEVQLTDQFSNLKGVQLLNDSTAFFLLFDGELGDRFCTTTNLFENWTVRYENEHDIHAFYALDEYIIFASMDDSLGNQCVMKSLDGGHTWKKKQTIWNSINLIYFSTSGIGFILGNGVYKSLDGGETWILNHFHAPFRDVFFLDKDKGFAVSHLRCGGRGHSRKDDSTILFMEICGGNIFLTNDGGTIWSHYLNTPVMGSLLFVNEFIGYFINNASINKTYDQGQTWKIVYENNFDSTGYDMWLNDMDFMDENVGWAVGVTNWSEWDSSGAGILGTQDGGETWGLVWKYPNTDEYVYGLSSIHAVNNIAWAVGGSLIAKFTEQDQWQTRPSITDLPLRNVFFSDENHGWISGGYFDEDNVYLKLFITEDGGENWDESEFDYEINDMFFENNLHGWVVGNDTSYSGMILQTEDGGNTWNVQIDELSAPLTAIHFKDGYGWAVGGNGLVLKTDDGVNWIEETPMTTKIPHKFELLQNYPNPFNPSTQIKYSLPKAGKVRIEIFNTLGQKIQTLLNKPMPTGHHEVEFNAQNLPSGIYFYRIQVEDPARRTGEFHDVKKMVLIK